MQNLSANSRIAKNSIFMSVRMVIVLLVTLYTSRIVLQALGVEDYGIYNVVAGFVTMFGFINSSLSNGIQRFFNYELGKNGIEGANKVYNMALIIQIILALIVILPTEIIGTWYLHNKMVIPVDRMNAAEWVFQLSLLTFLLHILQVPYTAAVMAHERMDFYAFVSIFSTLLTLGGAFFIPFYDGDYLIFYAIIISLVAFISLLLYFIYAKKSFKEISLSYRFNKLLFKEMISFSGWNLFGTMGHMLKDQGVNLILNFFFGPTINAARGIANQINSGLHGFVSNITIPVRPQVVQSYSQGNVNRSLNLTYTISKLSCYILLVMSLPLLLEVDYVLRLWLGDNIPKYTSVFVIIIVLNSFLTNLNTAISGIVHASGNMRKYQLYGGCISIVSVIVVFIAMFIYKTPPFALIIILIMDTIRQGMALLVLKSIVPEFSFHKYLLNVISPIIVVGVLSVSISILPHYFLNEGFVRLVIVTITVICSASILIYILGLTQSERNLFKQIIQRIKRK